jgi:hypothetical protein
MKISFDFDGTLEDDFDGTVNKQKEEIQKLAKRYVSDGHDVCIITKRYGYEKSNLGIGNEHLKVYYLANELGIDKVYFTNREMKFNYIINLGIDRHFENDDYEVQLIKQVCDQNNHKCLVVPVEDSYWRDLVY